MKIINLKDGGVTDLSAYKQRTKRFGNITQIDKNADFSGVEWQQYGDEEDDRGIKKSVLYKLVRKLNKNHKKTIDLLHCFIGENNWQDNTTLGWKLGGTVQNAQIALTKHRENYDDTGIHEVLHAVWDYVYIHTGKKLEDELGFSEDELIHGDHPDFTEYQYREVIEMIKPYYQEALGEDLSDEYRHVGQIALRLLKKKYRQLKLKDHVKKSA